MKKRDLLGDLCDAAGLTKSAALANAEVRARTAPSPEPEYPAARCARLDRERNERDRIAKRGYDYDPTAPSHREYIFQTPAGSLIRTCLEYGVGLKLDPDGTLVIISNGRAWRWLIDALEAHVDEIADLLRTGWDPYDA